MGKGLRFAALALAVAALALVALGPCAVDRALNRVTEPEGAPVSEAARRAHAALVVVDLHADPLIWSRDLARRAGHGHVDLPRLREGNVALQVFGLATKTPLGLNFERNESDAPDMMTALVVLQRRPPRTWGSVFERARDQAARLEAAAQGSGGAFRVLRTRGDLERFLADRAGDPSLVAGLLAVEGLHALEGRLEHVDALFDVGVRMMGLAHFFDNEVSGSAHGAEKGGLTPFGRQVIARMEERGIALDLAHAAPRAFDDALASASRPVVVSHTGVQATCPGPRNLSDDQLRRVAAQGGLVGIGFFPGAVCGEDTASVARALRHARDVAGAAAVAFGSDWDGATSAPFDAVGLPRLSEALLGAGFAPEELRQVAGENALRVLQQTLPD